MVIDDFALYHSSFHWFIVFILIYDMMILSFILRWPKNNKKLI